MKTEIIDLEDPSYSCTKANSFPIAKDRAIGGWINQKPFICGGYDGGPGSSISSLCYNLHDNGEWKKDQTSLNIPRRSSAKGSVVMNGNHLVVAGGSSGTGQFLNTIEVVTPSSGSKTLSTKLPSDTFGGCIVKWDHTTFAVIGGYGGKRQSTTFVDLITDTYSAGPKLNIGRSYLACHEMTFKGETFIVVTGGGDEDGKRKSTEVLSKSSPNNQWQKGKDLPVDHLYHDMVAFDGSLYTISKNGVYKLSCDGANSITDCQWKATGGKMKYPREKAVAISVSNAFADKICN